MLYSMTFAISTEPNTILEKSSSSSASIAINESYFIAPIAVGFIVIAMVYAFGHISGAHFNPAITVAVWIRGFITPIDAGLFILMQLLGSFSGAMLAWIITDEIPFIVPAAHHGDSHVPQGRCLLAEIIYSFAICLVVINVATTESQRGNFFYGVSIGMTVASGLASVQRISGGCFNPALGTALSVTHTFKDGGTIQYIWIYLVGPIIGAVVAGYSFYVINAKEVEQAKMAPNQY